jgi:hypothetical protein
MAGISGEQLCSLQFNFFKSFSKKLVSNEMKTTVFLAKVCVYLLGLSGRFGKILEDFKF